MGFGELPWVLVGLELVRLHGLWSVLVGSRLVRVLFGEIWGYLAGVRGFGGFWCVWVDSDWF